MHEFEKLFMMLSLHEKLLGHPKYVGVLAKLSKEVDSLAASIMDADKPRVVAQQEPEPEPDGTEPIEPEPETPAVPRRI